jgi:3-deoxy-D-manno-octulosonate 8-phosphate phosphatase (KDO 8-P phosphatase)
MIEDKFDIMNYFHENGGIFYENRMDIVRMLPKVEAFVFDWDGVFNDGMKSSSKGSSFSMVDKMGLNMLRFSYWLLNKKLPFTAIISGANNQTAIDFGTGDSLNAVIINSKNKVEAFDILAKKYNISLKNTVFAYDDILDLSLAKECLFPIFVKRKSNIVLNSHIRKHKLAYYTTFSEGGQNAIREIAELFIAFNDNYDEVVENRGNHTDLYKKYLVDRGKIETQAIDFLNK